MKRTLFNADHDAFRESVEAYIDRTLRPDTEKHQAEHVIPRDAWLEAGRQGLLGLEVPESYGGSEAGDFRFNAVLDEELAKLGAAYASAFAIHIDIVAPYLVDLTTDEQKAEYLPRFCTGEVLTAIGMTEPSGGSDLAHLRTTAVRDGSDWIINGSKTFITNGGSADLIILAVRTEDDPGARGVSLFLVEATAPGFERGRVLDKVGQPEANTSELFFTDMRVPAGALLGERGQGFVSMMQRLPQERLSCAVANIANAADILLETIQYTKDRKAFGQSIGSFQHNKFKIAEMITKIEVTQAFVDKCIDLHTRQELTATDAAMAKWWASDVQCSVIDTCVQLFGGYGYMNEYRVARAWKDARVHPIWAGSNEIMKELIGREAGL